MMHHSDHAEIAEVRAALAEITTAWDSTEEVDTNLGTDVQNFGERLCLLLDELTRNPEVSATLREEVIATYRTLSDAIDHYDNLTEHDTTACMDIFEALAPAVDVAERALHIEQLSTTPTDGEHRFWATAADASQPATHAFAEHTAQVVDEQAGGAVAYVHDRNADWITAALNAAATQPAWAAIAEPYAVNGERFIVTLVVGYGPGPSDGEVTTPQQAALAALQLTRHHGARSTVWHVHDRATGTTHRFDQSEFDQDLETNLMLTRAEVRSTYDRELPADMGDGPFTIYPDIDPGLASGDDVGLCTVARGGDVVFCLTCEAHGLLDGYLPTAEDIERWHCEL